LRSIEHAFGFAAREGRQKVTAVQEIHNAKPDDIRFLRCCRAVARRHPDIRYEESAPQPDPFALDVVVTTSRYGRRLSDIASGIAGGPEALPQVNFGRRYAIFESIDGNNPAIAGLGVANPTALLRAAALLLEHLGEGEAASNLTAAIEDVYRGGRVLTPDFGGSATTDQFSNAVIDRLAGCRGSIVGYHSMGLRE
jgi:isocitrate dehydrogenase (NAD+)